MEDVPPLFHHLVPERADFLLGDHFFSATYESLCTGCTGLFEGESQEILTLRVQVTILTARKGRI